MDIDKLISKAMWSSGHIANKKPSIALLARHMNVTRPTIYNWLNGSHEPRKNQLDALEILAEFRDTYVALKNAVKIQLKVLCNERS